VRPPTKSLLGGDFRFPGRLRIFRWTPGGPRRIGVRHRRSRYAASPASAGSSSCIELAKLVIREGRTRSRAARHVKRFIKRNWGTTDFDVRRKSPKERSWIEALLKEIEGLFPEIKRREKKQRITWAEGRRC
jgi:hypothetical protein